MRFILINDVKGTLQPVLKQVEESIDSETGEHTFCVPEPDGILVVAFDSADRQMFAVPMQQFEFGSEIWVGNTNQFETGDIIKMQP